MIPGATRDPTLNSECLCCPSSRQNTPSKVQASQLFVGRIFDALLKPIHSESLVSLNSRWSKGQYCFSWREDTYPLWVKTPRKINRLTLSVHKKTRTESLQGEHLDRR